MLRRHRDAVDRDLGAEQLQHPLAMVAGRHRLDDPGEAGGVERGEEIVTFSTGLGIATGIAFDGDGTMYVGDRSGTIYKISGLGDAQLLQEVTEVAIGALGAMLLLWIYRLATRPRPSSI